MVKVRGEEVPIKSIIDVISYQIVNSMPYISCYSLSITKQRSHERYIHEVVCLECLCENNKQ